MSDARASSRGQSIAKAAVSTFAAAAGAGPIAPLLGLLIAPVSDEIARAQSIALKSAEQLSGMSREDLADAIAKDPASVNLLTKLLLAAGQNRHDELLKMMGWAFIHAHQAATVGNRDEELADMEAVLDSIRFFDPLHIALLVQIEDRGMLNNIEAAAAFPDRVKVLAFHLAGLVQAGLVDNPYGRFAGDAGESEFYELSELGALVLLASKEVATRV